MAKAHKPSKLTLQEDHDKWLRKRGVHPDQLAKKHKAHASIPSYRVERTAPTSDAVGNGYVRSSKKYSGSGVHVGQAYNKGNLVVLSAKEANDSATGKRRT